MKTKYCTKCEKTKFISEFYKHKDHSDGLSTHCKKCVNKRNKQWRQNNQKIIS
jgi:hypothetical protein